MPSAGHGVAPPPKVVLDTNVLLSALLFHGVTTRLVNLWQTKRIVLLISKPILEEYLRALAYSKFNLTEKEIRALIEDELLPFVETVVVRHAENIPFPKDPDDRKFLECARAGSADYLLTGDKAVISLNKVGKTIILAPGEFLKTEF